MKYRPYPKYKPSGVDWLGEVPEHWEVKAIKWTTPVFRGASPRPIDDPVYFDEEGEYAWVRISDVTASNVILKETTQRLSNIGSALSVKLKPGELFLSIAATVGVPCIAGIKCCIHDGFVYFPRLKADIKFMYYIFACGEPYKGLGKMGTQLNLNTDTIGSIIMGFPPLPEQQAIASFLDRETGRIDELIGKKKKLVELLKEKRTALISDAVTGKRRVNPSAAFGSSSPIRGALLMKRGLICDGHSLPYNPKLKDRARELRKNMTTAERRLWYDYLRSLPQKFYRQRPIDHYIADFYCSEARLIIELDGSQHYTEEGLTHDQFRTDILETYGLHIIRFTNDQVLNQFDSVCETINEYMRQRNSWTSQSPSATSPISGEPVFKPPLEGEVARSAGGVKPSGVDGSTSLYASWLGYVPEHWEVKRSRFTLKINPSKQEINHLDEETELSFLPMETVGEDGSLNLENTRPISEVKSGYTYFAEGDVTFAKITPCFENGKGAIMQGLINSSGFGTTELTVLRPSRGLDKEYLYFLTISNEFRKNGEAWMYGAGGQKRVPDDFVKNFRFAYPPLPEQQAIASFLDRETAKIDALAAKVEEAIEKLKEYRTALISAAVTGKIDVSTGLNTSVRAEFILSNAEGLNTGVSTEFILSNAEGLNTGAKEVV